MNTYKAIVRYDGTRYKGWQRLKNTQETIQGKIETVLSRLVGEEIEIQGSGRTDAGAHAMGQVFHFKTEAVLDHATIMAQINQYLPEDIALVYFEKASDNFHARFDAVEKTYVYRLWKAPYPPVFERKYVAPYDCSKLDVEKMKLAATRVLGEKDFKGFCTDKTKKSTVRTIKRVDIRTTKEEVIFTFVGDGFLYNMVRILVGTLMEIGMGTKSLDSIDRVFETKDRSYAGFTAQAQGLCLLQVAYPHK